METWKEIMTNGPLATFSETGCGETLEDMKKVFDRIDFLKEVRGSPYHREEHHG